MNTELWSLLFVSSICSGFLGGFVGNRVNRACAGAALGLLFGPMGFIAAFALKEKRRPAQTTGKVRKDRQPKTIEFVCHKCGNMMSAPDTLGGTVDRCGKCRAKIIIPERIAASQLMPAKLMQCEDCGEMISRKAAACPKCGCPNDAER